MMKFYCLDVVNMMLVVKAALLFAGGANITTSDAFQYSLSTVNTINLHCHHHHVTTTKSNYIPTDHCCLQQYKYNKPINCNNCNNDLYICRPLSFSSSSFQLFAVATSVPPEDENDYHDDDDDDSVVPSNKYDLNKQQNRQWLITKFKFPKKRLEQQVHNYSFMTLDNSILAERSNWLQTKLDFTDKEMNRVIQYFPYVLNRKSNTNLEPTLYCLETILKLDKALLKKLVLKDATVLGAPKDDIQQKVDWMQQRLDLKDSQVVKIIQKKPEILALSLYNNIEPTVQWLQNRFDLKDSQIGKIIQNFPQLLTLSLQNNSEPSLKWLEQRLSPTESQLSHLVTNYPQILSLSITKNIAPKIDFYLEAAASGGSDVEDIIDLLCRDARLLTASLGKRLKPRLKEARDANLTIDAPCLQRMARYTPEDWSEYIG